MKSFSLNFVFSFLIFSNAFAADAGPENSIKISAAQAHRLIKISGKRASELYNNLGIIGCALDLLVLKDDGPAITLKFVRISSCYEVKCYGLNLSLILPKKFLIVPVDLPVPEFTCNHDPDHCTYVFHTYNFENPVEGHEDKPNLTVLEENLENLRFKDDKEERRGRELFDAAKALFLGQAQDDGGDAR